LLLRESEVRVLHELSVRTTAQECLVEITDQVARVVRESGVMAGVALLYVPHTTCGLTIQENADPGVQHDMLLLLRQIAPREDPRYRHIEDNSASHLQASAMGFSTFVFVERGQLVLGRWQTIYLAEFDGPRTRRVLLKLLRD
jgi:secondary thiamine-phosphate synthase enzyme